MNNELLFDVMYEALGADLLLDELSRAISADELRDCLDWIARNNDIDLDACDQEL